jgi:hypothetical protein
MVFPLARLLIFLTGSTITPPGFINFVLVFVVVFHGSRFARAGEA